VNGIPVDVPQLLNPLGLARDIEVVIARLPERHALDRAKFASGILLEHLQCDGQLAALGFTDQQVNVFRHDYVSYDYEPVTAADSFEDFQE